jgi:hypothetical protein
VSALIPEAEFFEWNRAAQQAGMDLSTWLRTLVNDRHSPIERVAESPEPVAPLQWRDEREWPSCEYCGHYLDFTATRRKRFCSDVCRVKAWRFQKRAAEA